MFVGTDITPELPRGILTKAVLGIEIRKLALIMSGFRCPLLSESIHLVELTVLDKFARLTSTSLLVSPSVDIDIDMTGAEGTAETSDLFSSTDFIHFHENTDSESSSAAMVMHFFTFLASACWQKRRVKDHYQLW